MFKMKNAALTMAVVLALAACGGGSDDPAPSNNVPTNPGNDGTNPGTDPGTNPGATQDAVFQGHMVLAANQVLFNGNGIDYTTFNTTGAYGQARGTSAPLQSFGLRVYQDAMLGQSENVRIAIELDDTEGDGLIQMLVDRATLSINETGVMSITVPAEAKAHVVVNDGAGSSKTVSATGLAADTISFTPIADDPTSFGLTVNMDAIMAAAIAAAPEADRPVLQAARDVEGVYNMRMAVSGVTLLNQAGNPLTPGTTPITVGTQPAVSGGGVNGVFYIGITPAALK